MFLNTQDILQYISDHNMVTGTCDDWLENDLEGGKLDVHLDEMFIQQDQHMKLTQSKRELPGYIPAVTFYDGDEFGPVYYCPGPGRVYQVTTTESFNIPDWILPIAFPKTTLATNGVSVLTAPLNPGFSGRLKFGLIVHGTLVLDLFRHAPLATIVFGLLTGIDCRLYKGAHQGGAIPTGKHTTGRR